MAYLEKAFYRIGLSLLAVFMLIFLLYHFQIVNVFAFIPDCWIYKFTGHYCPGCGMTRAVFSLSNFHLIRSLSYHPFVIYTVFVYGLFLFRNTGYLLFSQGHIFSPKASDTKKETKKEFFLLRFFQKPMMFRISYIMIGVALILIQCVIKNLLHRPYLF